MTSCARRSISGLPRWTESKSRSAVLVPVAIDDGAAAHADAHAGAAQLHQQAADRDIVLVVCCDEMLPMPPAIMIGLW
jgi:hypothetical protein